jgi:cell division protein FtsI/penicillin-binding protein 2
MEAGSVMKPLTTAAALDMGAIQPDQKYNDPSSWVVDKFRITNVEEGGGPGVRSITDILNLSLNTGVTWELMQMGGGEINDKGRKALHDYMTNHYRFGKETGIEQGYESAGYVPDHKDNDAGINLTYANMSFGQAMTVTPIQLAGALSSVVNGGTYYQPKLVDRYVRPDGTEEVMKPVVLQKNVVSPEVTKDLLPMMEYTVSKHNFRPAFDSSLYRVGGKTGTAQIAKPGGGYYEDKFNGAYVGYVGGDKIEYVIAVYVYTPTIGGYAGFAAAQPVFSDIAHTLINNSYVTPKR